MELSVRHPFVRYGVALAAALQATVLRLLLDSELGHHHPLTFYLCAVAFATWFGGLGPALLTLVVGLLLGDWFFLEPRFNFVLSDLPGWVACGVYLASGLVIIYFSRATHAIYHQAALKATEALNCQLKERVAELETLLDVVPVGILIAEDADCQKIRANRAMTRLFNVHASTNFSLTAEGNKLPWRLYLQGREVASHELPLQQSAKQGVEIEQQEYEYVYEDGRRLSVEVYATPLFGHDNRPRGSIGVVIDRTQQKAEQERVARSEKRYRSLVEATSALVFIGDNLGRCTVPQPKWEAFTGLTWEQYRDYGWQKAVHPDDRQQAQAVWEQAIQSGTFSESVGRLWHAPSQQYRYMRTFAAPIRDEQGQVVEWVGTSTDIDEQAKLQAALQASEERLRLALKAARMVAWEADLTKSVMIYSSNASEVFGHTSGRTTQTIEEALALIHPEDRGRVLAAHLRSAREGRSISCRYRILRPDNGTYVWSEDFGNVVYDESGQVTRLFGIARDVGEEVRLEHELKAQKEMFDAFMDHTPAAIFVKNEEGRYLYANRVAAQCAQIGQDQLHGKTDFEVLPAEIAQQLREADKSVLESGEPAQVCEAIFIDHAERSWMSYKFPFRDSEGKPLLGGISFDVTEQKRLESERCELAAILDALVDNVPLSIALFDTRLRHLRVNARLAEVCGISKKEPVGKRLSEVVPCLGAKMEGGLSQVLASDQPILNEELEWQAPTTPGVERCWQASYFPVRLPSGKRLGVGAILQEITQRKQLEQALQQRADELAESDHRKDQFLAMLGHELRNPLAGIANGVQVLNMIGSDDQDAIEMREVIERQAQHMAHLIDDLLDVSRISRGKIQLRRKRLDLTELVRKTAENHRRQMEEHGLALVVNLPREPVWVDADPTRLSQVMGNLLNNAMKFTDAGGQVAVTLTQDRQSHTAQLSHKDTGIGMEPHLIKRLFEPFSQADSSLDRTRGGLGLGLALVKGLVEMHGGEVWARSPGLGQGTEIHIRLPLAEEGSQVRPPTPEHRSSLRSYRVLLIDDRRDAILPLRKMLTILGQQVEVADSGKSGLEKAKEFRPEIVLCDIGLPDLNGYEVAQALRNDPALSSAYLVAVTGYGQEEDRRRAAEAGFDYHITKPVAKEQLAMLLSEHPQIQMLSDAGH